MKLTDEAIEAFKFEHEFRCPATKRNCNHVKLIEKAHELDLIEETLYEQNLLMHHLSLVNEKTKERAINHLDTTRREWLDVQDLPHESFASWVDSVFEVAAKVLRES